MQAGGRTNHSLTHRPFINLECASRHPMRKLGNEFSANVTHFAGLRDAIRISRVLFRFFGGLVSSACSPFSPWESNLPGEKQCFIFALEISEFSRYARQNRSHSAAIYVFERRSQFQLPPVNVGVFGDDPAGRSCPLGLQHTINVFDSLDVSFPKFEVGVYLPENRSRVSLVKPTKMCQRRREFLPI